jgi:hypothetical protein
MNADDRPVITEDNKTAVRAGSTENNVRYVLICSSAAWPWRSSPGFLSSISSGRECPRG